jgi:hypothetical protein
MFGIILSFLGGVIIANIIIHPQRKYATTAIKVAIHILEEKLIKSTLSSLGIVVSNKNNNLIWFKVNGKNHRILIRSKLINNEIEQVFDGETDITNNFIEYIGPQSNFFGQKYTPRDLGYKNLRIVYILEDDVEFKIDEEIKV